MAIVLRTAVLERGTASGSGGVYSLLGAPNDRCFSFASRFSHGDQTYIRVVSRTAEFDAHEIVLATLDRTNGRLTRSQLIAGSNGNSPVAWPVATPVDIVCVLPGEVVGLPLLGKHTVDFVDESTVTVTHNLGDDAVMVQVRIGGEIALCTVDQITANGFRVVFSQPETGTIVYG